MTAVLLALLAVQDPFARSGVGAARVGSVAYVIGGAGIYQEEATSVVGYDLNARKWSRLAYLPEAVYFPSCVASGGKVLVFGGLHRDGTACNHARSYDPKQDQWEELPTMPTARSRASATVVDGKAYVIGGIEGGGKNSARVEVYDTRTRAWSRAASLSLARHGHSAEQVGGKIVVAGGYAGTEQMAQTASVEVWTAEGGWKKGADMPEARGFAQSVAFEGAMWVFGNRGGANHPVRYDPAADKWTAAASEDTGRHRGAAVELGGKAYLLFGEEGLDGLVAVFDLARGSWVGRAR